MLMFLLNFITDTPKTAATAIVSAAVGQVSFESRLNVANTALQHSAWVVAILAGILTIINLFFPLRTFYENYKAKKEEKERFLKRKR